MPLFLLVETQLFCTTSIPVLHVNAHHFFHNGHSLIQFIVTNYLGGDNFRTFLLNVELLIFVLSLINRLTGLNSDSTRLPSFTCHQSVESVLTQHIPIYFSSKTGLLSIYLDDVTLCYHHTHHIYHHGNFR